MSGPGRFAAFEAEKDLGSRETCVCVPLHEAERSVMGQRKDIHSDYWHAMLTELLRTVVL